MAGENFECEECGESFSSKRGLHIHQSRMHDDPGNTEGNKENEDEKIDFSLSVNHALIAVFALGVLVGFSGGVVLPLQMPTQGTDSDPAQQKQDTGNRVAITSEMLENEPSLGNSDAPLKIVEYSDYGCPWCAEWAGFEAIPDDATRVTGTIDERETLKKIKENYVQTGKAQFVFKDYPVRSLHPNAPSAHKAANCALEQDSSLYWDYHDKLFQNRDEWKQSNAPAEQFNSYAKELGLNVSRFSSCYRNSDNSEVEEDKSQIESLTGRLGTPAIFIGNEKDGFVMIEGAQPYSSLKNVLDSELEKARK